MSVTIDLSPELEARLKALAAETGKDPKEVLSAAIASGLEDIEDLLLAERAVMRLKSGESRILSVEEAGAAFELDR
ncbi:type II toxin-antitoxin system RelB family antitoxin [Pelagibacterium sp.]|uniref:type II toxin-antitoxin system RelB family antitoxin n=1 Tax=Pelagibacterium sp. TaxID=1967288 RepID=UPI003BAB31B5